MTKENKVIIAIAIAVIFLAIFILVLVRDNGQSAERPVVVNSTLQMPDRIAELLKHDTNRQVVVNNTLQMPDRIAELLKPDANRPVVVNSTLQMPDRIAELLEHDTNRQVVVNNTFQLPDNFADTQQKISALQIVMSERIDGVDHAVGELSRKLEERERQEKQKANEDVEVAREKLEADKRDAMAALFAINHINWVVTKIKSYNDPMVLEEEYKNICADALNLNTIKDQEIIELICDIMDVITDMRIEEKEREFLKEELDQGMSDAIYEAFSGISAGGGLSPAAAVFNILSSAATSAMNYKRAKRQLLAAYKKKTWGLDKNRMIYLNELNKSLLQRYWKIVQRYNLPDEYRVSEQDIALLIDHLKDENPQRQHDFLVSMEDKYKGLQNYWYYRGLAAYQCTVTNDITDVKKLRLMAAEKKSRMFDAKHSLDLYQKARSEFGSMLRIDGIAAKAAMLQIRFMVAENEDCAKNSKPKVWNEDQMRKAKELLAIIEHNSTIEEWQTLYFCALVYVNQLKDIATADKVLAPIIAHLDYKRNRRLVDWQELVLDNKASKSTNAVDRLVASGDALFECRKLLATGATNLLGMAAFESRIAKICDDENASAREKIFCYGDLSYKKALEKMLPDLRKMRILRDGKKLKISLPMSWVVSREGESRLGVSDREDFMNNGGGKTGTYNKENEKQERSIEERDDGLYALVDFGDFEDIDSASKVIYTIRYDRADKAGSHIKGSYLVVVAFDINGSKVFKPNKACFGPWVVGEGRKKSNWKTKPGTNKPDFEIQSL